MKNIILTICSNNYLAQAKILYDSVVRNSIDTQFIIGLVDKLNSEVDYSIFGDTTIIECDNIGVNDFNSLWKKFSIIELNTALKPFFLKYIFSKYKNIENIYYFDPDIKLFNNINYLDEELNNYNIILTPHILSPIGIDNYNPKEELFLNFGVFNLGFIGLKRSNETDKLLEWWGERTFHLGFNNTAKGLFVDQLWLNYAPIFFSGVKIVYHLGCNVAPWNLHERKLSLSSGKYYVNSETELLFYHFSNIDLQNQEKPFKGYDRYNFENRPDIIEIYKEYRNDLMKIYDLYSSVPCYWIDKRIQNQKKNSNVSLKQKIKRKIIKYIKKI